MATAKPIIRTGMDRPVYYYRGFRLVRLARGGFGERVAAADDVRLAAFLNAIWSPLFFGLHRIDLGFLDIVLLWLSIVATIALFYPVNAIAALLLLPYLAWVTFAAVLNFAVWRLNSSAT